MPGGDQHFAVHKWCVLRFRAAPTRRRVDAGRSHLAETSSRTNLAPSSHGRYAIAISQTSAFEGTKATITKSFVVKACLSPQPPPLHHPCFSAAPRLHLRRTSPALRQSPIPFSSQEHFAKAVELNPRDPTSRHLLGVWFFEVASLSWSHGGHFHLLIRRVVLMTAGTST